MPPVCVLVCVVCGPWKVGERMIVVSLPAPDLSSAAIGRAGVWGGAAKLVRARGGCLGARRRKGAAGCDKSGGAAKRALIPGCPSQPGELKHLSTRRKGKKPRLRQ